MITKDELIEEIFNSLKDRKIPEAEFLYKLMSRLPSHWLNTELSGLVNNRNIVRLHQKVKIHPDTSKHPWRTYGQRKNGRSL